MFTEMGTAMDADTVAAAFRNWVTAHLAAGTYRSWVVEGPSGGIVAGGGMTVIPWPPGPWYVGGRIAFIYNVYTEPTHRRRGVALVLNVDGFGDPPNKIARYDDFNHPRSRFHRGFKVFYKEDTSMMSPQQVLELRPRPDLVIYE